MTDHILLKAASLMRERANDATQGDWFNRRGPGEHVMANAPVRVAVVATTETREDRRHIAGWQPSVAFAVAAWLEAEYEACKGWDHYAIPEALAVARAYLGEVTQ